MILFPLYDIVGGFLFDHVASTWCFDYAFETRLV